MRHLKALAVFLIGGYIGFRILTYVVDRLVDGNLLVFMIVTVFGSLAIISIVYHLAMWQIHGAPWNRPPLNLPRDTRGPRRY